MKSLSNAMLQVLALFLALQSAASSAPAVKPVKAELNADTATSAAPLDELTLLKAIDPKFDRDSRLIQVQETTALAESVASQAKPSPKGKTARETIRLIL